MSVTNQVPRKVSTAAVGATVFPYDFKVVSKFDMQVQVDGVDKTVDVDFTISGVGLDAGGDITFLAPMIGGEVVMRRRRISYERSVDYQNLGDLRSATLNNDQDAPVMMIQQLADDVALSAKLPPAFTSFDTTIPTPIAGAAIGFDLAGTGFRAVDTFGPADLTLRTDLADAAAGAALVNFKQSGAGAASRTAQDKLREQISVKDFGAIGDGVADDRPAIVAAIVHANSIGAPWVYFPAGVYRISNTIILGQAGCGLVGVGSSLRTGFISAGGVGDVGIGKHEGASRILADFVSGPVIRIQNSGQTIRDLVVDASETRRLAARSTNYGILVESLDASGEATKGTLLERLRVINQPSHGIVLVNDIASSRIDLVDVDNCNGHGIFVSGGVLTGRTFVARPGQLQINNARVSRTAGHCLLVGGNEVGSDDVPYRIEVRNLEAFYNLIDQSLSVDAVNKASAYISGENCSISDSAFDGRTQYPSITSTHICLYLRGNNHKVWNQRLISGAPYGAYVGAHPIVGTTQVEMDVLFAAPVGIGAGTGYYNPAIFIEPACVGVDVSGGRPVGVIGTLTNRASIGYVERYNGAMRTNESSVFSSIDVDRARADLFRTQDEFTLNDDTAGYIEFSSTARGMLLISGSSAGAKYAMVHFRCGDGNAHITVMSASSGVVGMTGVLTGTTGADSNLTLSADTATNRIYIENRTGGSPRAYTLTLLGVNGANQSVGSFT